MSSKSPAFLPVADIIDEQGNLSESGAPGLAPLLGGGAGCGRGLPASGFVHETQLQIPVK